ncbi:MAG: type II toxin-antitoxin system VapC family toxin [Sulfuricella sp.]|nr:type II toxin-antitoxin system VapC family toxin [Sulfuricella sp.]
MIRYLADTNILGYLLRHTYPALHQRLLAAMQAEEVAISVATRAEIRFGQALLDATDKRRTAIDLLLKEMTTLAWTNATADCYGSLAAHLRKIGQPIGTMDTLIAAHALAENLILVTHNTRHFERVPGLQLEDWAVLESA